MMVTKLETSIALMNEVLQNTNNTLTLWVFWATVIIAFLCVAIPLFLKVKHYKDIQRLVKEHLLEKDVKENIEKIVLQYLKQLDPEKRKVLVETMQEKDVKGIEK